MFNRFSHYHLKDSPSFSCARGRVPASKRAVDSPLRKNNAPCASLAALCAVLSEKHREMGRRLPLAKRQNKRQLPGWLIAALDMLVIGAVIGIFFLFHHVIPREGGGPIQTIVDVSMPTQTAESTPEPHQEQPLEYTPQPEMDEKEMVDDAPLKEEPAPEEDGEDEEKKAQPTPIPGDFSATFPNYDTGIGKDHSYQSGNVRIAIDKIKKNGVAYCVADIWIRNIASFRTAFADDKYGRGIIVMPRTISKKNKAIVGLTGDYYGARSSGVVIRNGQLYRSTPYEDVCVLYQDGTLETYTKDGFDIDDAISRGAYQAWCFGPRLLIDGEPIGKTNHSLQKKNPRAAIGYYEPGHYVFVVVDGRQKHSAGITLTDLSQLFYELGCEEAYNLDGGQSAAMTHYEEYVNSPVDNGRPVSDILCIVELE